MKPRVPCKKKPEPTMKAQTAIAKREALHARASAASTQLTTYPQDMGLIPVCPNVTTKRKKPTPHISK